MTGFTVRNFVNQLSGMLTISKCHLRERCQTVLSVCVCVSLVSVAQPVRQVGVKLQHSSASPVSRYIGCGLETRRRDQE